ncbi:unnamed protein product [Natator depressus]
MGGGQARAAGHAGACSPGLPRAGQRGAGGAGHVRRREKPRAGLLGRRRRLAPGQRREARADPGGTPGAGCGCCPECRIDPETRFYLIFTVLKKDDRSLRSFILVEGP